MDASGAEDGTDFRPFFDMVIGILFVLLILVAAQIYFQQAQSDTVASEATKREAALRRAAIASFLDGLSGRLRAAGLTATANVEESTISIPLREVLSVDRSGLPAVDASATARLGATVAGATACVTVPRQPAPRCQGLDRLHLEELAIDTRIASLPAGIALPGTRFGTLAATLISAATLGATPDLLTQSNDDGSSVIRFDRAVTYASSTVQAGSSLGGDVSLSFSFR